MKKRRRRTAAFWRWAALGLMLATVPACSPDARDSTREQGTGEVATLDTERANAFLAEAFEAYNGKDYATALTKCGASLAFNETKAAQDLMEMCKKALRTTSAPSEVASEEASEVASEEASEVASEIASEVASEEASAVAVDSLDEWTKAAEAGALKSLELDGITYNFRFCPSGTFAMGSPEDEKERGGREGKAGGSVFERQHIVTLSQFWMLKTEVTVGMWRSFVKATNYQMGSGRMGMGMYGVTEAGTMFLDSKYTWDNPGYPQTEEHPVVGIDWPGAVAFGEWLAKETGLPVRLPTEAEWEYACRAGTTTAYSFGSDADALTEYANVFDSQEEAPLFVTGRIRTLEKTVGSDGYKFPAPAKRFKPNAWNLYDMHGNVTEWCRDLFAPYDSAAQTDPVGGELGSKKGMRVVRGGAWNKLPADCRSAMRFYCLPENQSVSNGFRVAIGRKIEAEASDASNAER